MPVVLSTPTQVTTWLDTSEQKWTPKAAQVIRPYLSPSKEHDLECYPVPKEVGKVGTESPTFIESISKRKDGIEAMFAKQGSKSEKGKETKEEARTPTPTKPASKVGQSKRKRQSPERPGKDERESSGELLSLLASRTSPYPSSFRYSSTSLPFFPPLPEHRRMQGEKVTYGSTYCLLEAGRLDAFLSKVMEGKKNRQKLESLLSDRRVASRRRYLFGLCTLKCSLR